MITNLKYEKVNQKACPELSLVDVSVNGDQLIVNAPGMDTLILPLQESRNSGGMVKYGLQSFGL